MVFYPVASGETRSSRSSERLLNRSGSGFRSESGPDWSGQGKMAPKQASRSAARVQCSGVIRWLRSAKKAWVGPRSPGSWEPASGLDAECGTPGRTRGRLAMMRPELPLDIPDRRFWTHRRLLARRAVTNSSRRDPKAARFMGIQGRCEEPRKPLFGDQPILLPCTLPNNHTEAWSRPPALNCVEKASPAARPVQSLEMVRRSGGT
jgi:hypothetical protein